MHATHILVVRRRLFARVGELRLDAFCCARGRAVVKNSDLRSDQVGASALKSAPQRSIRRLSAQVGASVLNSAPHCVVSGASARRRRRASVLPEQLGAHLHRLDAIGHLRPCSGAHVLVQADERPRRRVGGQLLLPRWRWRSCRRRHRRAQWAGWRRKHQPAHPQGAIQVHLPGRVPRHTSSQQQRRPGGDMAMLRGTLLRHHRKRATRLEERLLGEHSAKEAEREEETGEVAARPSRGWAPVRSVKKRWRKFDWRTKKETWSA